MKKNIFPFTAIVGQDKIKKALILNAINPSIGGVLIRGDRGTGKTTAVRALADLLPEIEVIENFPFNIDLNSYKEFELYKNYKISSNDSNEELSLTNEELSLIKVPMKVVELPLGATEDRVVGSIDIEKALTEGIKSLEPGILADANNGILYIDEINLLDDNLVDVLLDAAATGVNIVEREGISITHPSKFILVGTMNPEEGDLRGQLSDRIGLKITAEEITDISDRIQIMKRREEFEDNPIEFRKEFDSNQEALKIAIIKAKEILKDVKISDEYIEIIARLTKNLGIEGHRSDISILKTSKTIAAFKGNLSVNIDDLEEAISLVLGELNQCNDPSQVKEEIQNIQDEMDNEDEDENESEQDDESSSDEANPEDNPQNIDDLDEDSNQNQDNNSNNLNDEDYNNDNNHNSDDNLDDNELDNDSNDNYNDFDDDNNQENNNSRNDLNNSDSNDNENNQNQIGHDSKESEFSDDDLRNDLSENQYEKSLNEFEIEELEKDIKKMLVLEGREKEKLYGSSVESKSEKGKYVKSKFSKDPQDIAIDATLRAAAIKSKPKHKNQGGQDNNFKNIHPNLAIDVKKEDLREKVRKHKARASIALVIDMSGSMVAEKKVNKIKGILEKIIQNINKNRDKLTVIGFKGKDSEVIIPNTKRPNSFLEKLEKISVGGTTPMASGLNKAFEILKLEKKNKEYIPMLILLSDGMPNVGIQNDHRKDIKGNPINDVLAIGRELAANDIYTIIVDFDKKFRLGRNVNMELAFLANGRYYDLEKVYDSKIAIEKILTYERANL